MNLDYLRSFFVIVQCNSISKAAKKLHLTQPGLSMQLQNLEKEIGANLLIRSNKGVELTDEGKVVFEHASTMLSLEDNIQNNIKDLKIKKNILSICSCNCLGAYVLPCSIYTFKEIYPDLEVSLDVCSTRTVIKKLINHETNIGILTSKYDVPSLVTHPLIEDKLILVSNPKIKYNEITLSDLKDLPLIIQNEDSSIRNILHNILKNHNINSNNLNLILTMNSSQSIKSAIISGHGFAFLPAIVVRQELRAGTMKKINIQDLNTKFNYYFAYRENHTFTQHEERFKKFILSKKRCFCY